MSTEGERIKSIRGVLKMKQQEFADFFGVSRTYLSSIENNGDVLSRKQLCKLLVTYNVSINYVLAGIGNMFIEDENALEDEAKEFTDNNKSLFVHQAEMQKQVDALSENVSKLMKVLENK